MKVFISGSIGIKRLPAVAQEKLDSIITRGYDVLVGDAPGVDLIVQKYLAQRGYPRVVVYYAGERARNNVNLWGTKGIAATHRERGRALFTLKDVAMAQDADYGLMIWDGKSPGTLNNMRMMARRGKKFIVVYEGSILSKQSVYALLETGELQEEPLLL